METFPLLICQGGQTDKHLSKFETEQTFLSSKLLQQIQISNNLLIPY